MGHTYDLSELQGLSRGQMQSGKVSFSLVREAGTIQCDGQFVDGRGSGTFTFTPNSSFIDAMRSRGFDFTKAASKRGDSDPGDRLFAAAALNVTRGCHRRKPLSASHGAKHSIRLTGCGSATSCRC